MHLALNPFGKGKKPEVVDEVKVEIDEMVERMFEKCRRWYNRSYAIPDSLLVDEWADKLDLDVLTPGQIDLVLQKVKNSGSFTGPRDATGLFLSKLIRESYLAGHTEFNLTTDDFPLSILNLYRGGVREFFMYLRRRPRFLIHGEIGKIVNTLFADYTVTGDVRSILLNDFCRFNLKGDTYHIYNNTACSFDINIVGHIETCPFSRFKVHSEYAYEKAKSLLHWRTYEPST